MAAQHFDAEGLGSFLDSLLGEDMLIGGAQLDPTTLAAAEGAEGQKAQSKRGRPSVPLADDDSDLEGSSDDDEGRKGGKGGGKKTKKDAAASKACREKARRNKLNERWVGPPAAPRAGHTGARVGVWTARAASMWPQPHGRQIVQRSARHAAATARGPPGWRSDGVGVCVRAPMWGRSSQSA
jgi:hypothetical protein